MRSMNQRQSPAKVLLLLSLLILIQVRYSRPLAHPPMRRRPAVRLQPWHPSQRGHLKPARVPRPENRTKRSEWMARLPACVLSLASPSLVCGSPGQMRRRIAARPVCMHVSMIGVDRSQGFFFSCWPVYSYHRVDRRW
ncbi:hypothetical protein B0J18DRAFT_21400 [Chaetomium sp. MPI-SDFR-AT-0129]|nr:hypothetical protein B0J18DRAFT_21400 [Chaetomium sp. MPI-SDFR-AT-0129]